MRGGVACVLLVALAVAGCGDAGDQASDYSDDIIVERINQAGDTVRAKSVILTGVVSEPDATVTVANRETTADARGRFRLRISLKVGDNRITVATSKRNRGEDTKVALVTRALTAEERAARDEQRAEERRVREEERRLREEQRRLEEEAELAELRTTAEALDPGQFQKDPDRYFGEQVTMTGQIFQIQEGGDNFFLMTTECETSYGSTFCDGPDVYVSYNFPTDKTEEDLVTVYGRAQGSYEYDTQIGGSNFVGHLKARIIE